MTSILTIIFILALAAAIPVAVVGLINILADVYWGWYWRRHPDERAKFLEERLRRPVPPPPACPYKVEPEQTKGQTK